MNLKKIIPLIAIPIVVILVIASIFIFFPLQEEGKEKEDDDDNDDLPNLEERKAFILCSANDFYGSSDDDFNNGNDSNFTVASSNWIFQGINAVWGFNTGRGSGGFSLDIVLTVSGSMDANYTYDWNNFRKLEEYTYYNMTAWICFPNPVVLTDGARMGLQWLNTSGQVVRTDWSQKIQSGIVGTWYQLNISGVCNNDTTNEISRLKLILSAKGNGLPDSTPIICFDDIKISKWISVNNTNPTDPPPPQGKADSDGFPAQALKVYWTLKSNGYTDKNIFLMLYHTNDNVIDIKANDGVNNDLIGAIIDVENDDVNSSRAKRELNVTISGSFASSITSDDQLIIYFVDHGANRVLTDGNATFHFEADKNYITEFEFYDLVKEIQCKRMIINMDCCFSGNFLNANKSIGSSWYNIPNCLFVCASANVASWYWINNNNSNSFAGSWFFYPFWDQLDQNKTISEALALALAFLPAVNQPAPIAGIQMPAMYDPLRIADEWSFNGTIQL